MAFITLPYGLTGSEPLDLSLTWNKILLGYQAKSPNYEAEYLQTQFFRTWLQSSFSQSLDLSEVRSNTAFNASSICNSFTTDSSSHSLKLQANFKNEHIQQETQHGIAIKSQSISTTLP